MQEICIESSTLSAKPFMVKKSKECALLYSLPRLETGNICFFVVYNRCYFYLILTQWTFGIPAFCESAPNDIRPIGQIPGFVSRSCALRTIKTKS